MMLKKSALFLPFLLSGCVAPLVVGGAGALLTTHAAQERGLSGSVSDQVLRYQLNQALDGGLADASGLELTVFKGRVLLAGIVANEQVKQQAVCIAGKVEGVRDIINGMDTHGEYNLADYSRDGWITTKLKTILFADEDVRAPDYIIRTFGGTVYIFGTAQNQQEIQKVIGHASEISGVKRVLPLIELCGAPPVSGGPGMPPKMSSPS